MSTFFDKLPLISYKGAPARNFLVRAGLEESTKRNASLYHPYTMREEDRIDVLSHLYYDDPNYIWLIFLANNIVDPYFDLPLTVEDFEKVITKKYGSREKAINTTLFYRNDWTFDESEYTVSQYNTIVAGNPALAKYYDALTDEYLNLKGYYRKREDWVASTNMIVRLTLSSITGTTADSTFRVGERVIYDTTNKGTVISADATTVTIQHIIGSFYPNNDDTDLPTTRPHVINITGEDSGIVATTSQSTILARPIPVNEVGLWAPVSAYDYEFELNEKRKSITLIENTLTGAITEQLTRVMRT